jgi:HlyD family secretion protein
MDRPKNTAPIATGVTIVVLFFGVLGAWAGLVPLSSAVTAEGQIKVSSHVKTVQHLEGGIIREILVREGDTVTEGQPLVRLDNTQSSASLELTRGEHDALKSLEARLIAERDGADTITFPADLVTRTVAAIAGQQTIFTSRRTALLGQFDILDQRMEQFNAEIKGEQAQVDSFTRQAALLTEEMAGVEELFKRGLERKPRLLSIQRDIATVEGQRGEQLSRIAKAGQGIGEMKMQRADLINKQRSEVATELRDVQTKLADNEEKLRAATDIHKRIEIVAPEAGKITNLRHFTLGGVVKPADPILDLVPMDDTLVIETQLRPLDIEEIHPDLPAEVRLTAYKQRRTPTVHGVVTYVSADAMTNEKTGQPYYVARVEVPQATNLALAPGMPAEVMIVTGKRTALAYLLDPINDSFARAFHEK